MPPLELGNGEEPPLTRIRTAARGQSRRTHCEARPCKQEALAASGVLPMSQEPIDGQCGEQEEDRQRWQAIAPGDEEGDHR
jgi:hypothetical protein